VLLHLRDDLRIGQLVRGFDSHNAFRQRLGVAQRLLELRLGLARPEDRRASGCPRMTAFLWSIQMPTLSFMSTALAPTVASCPALASPAAPASLHALLSHLLASRFAHPFVDRLLRRRFPMTLPRRVDWSAAAGACCLLRCRSRLVFLVGLSHCHWALLPGPLLQRESLIGVPETLHERSPPALRTLLVPHRTPLFLRQPERHLFGFAIILVFYTLVGMPRVRDGVDLFDRARRGMLAKSAANNDVIVSRLCWRRSAIPFRDQNRLIGFAPRGTRNRYSGRTDRACCAA
jgi:hypothetical protein